MCARLSESETWNNVRGLERKGPGQDAPLAQWHPTSGAGPDTVNPRAIASDDNEDEARLFLLVLYPGMQS